MRNILTTVAFALGTLSASAQATEIRLNQVGYFPKQEKIAIVECDKPVKKFTVLNAAGKKVLKGVVNSSAKDAFTGLPGYRINLTEITTPGEYVLEVNKAKMPFTVKNDALKELCKAGLKSYYFQRMGIALDKNFAGEYARPAAHMDEEVLVHASAATATRPEGTKLSCPKGWYDAGDYNKYIVNSSFAIGQMLNAYPMMKDVMWNLSVNIPESGNGAPDLLNELYYNLQWMFTMQDEDGGVYHKLTTPNFEGFIMPAECKQPRYVVQKTTCASLDFAACMALASRIYKPYESQFPGFSEAALDAAKEAYLWALKNPKVMYNQAEMNKNFKPAINTGTYGDFNANDEFFWASVEMYITTGKDAFLTQSEKYMPKKFDIPVWGQLQTLGLTSILTHWNYTNHAANERITRLANQAKEMLLSWADNYVANAENSMYLSPFGNKKEDFHWASMAEGAGTEAILLMQAYGITNNSKYLLNARRNMDYILGRNATGYCFVTGFGQKSPMNPHHRPSAADGIEKPIPGLLVGGPNASANEGNYFESSIPEKRYADNLGSYTTNEVAINWNSALVTLSGLLLATQNK